MDYAPTLLRRAFMTSTMLSTVVMILVLFNQSFVQGTLLARNPLNYQHLEARNLSTFFNSIPNGCEVDCEVVVGAVTGCATLSCVCTNDNAYALLQCINCRVALTPSVDGVVEQYQLIIDEWTNDYCKPFGTPPLQITRPGSSAASSPSPTATSSASRVMGLVMYSSPPLLVVISVAAAAALSSLG